MMTQGRGVVEPGGNFIPDLGADKGRVPVKMIRKAAALAAKTGKAVEIQETVDLTGRRTIQYVEAGT